jgi:hypothetical protein
MIKVIYNPYKGYACRDSGIEYFWVHALQKNTEISFGSETMFAGLRELVYDGKIDPSILEVYSEDIVGNREGPFIMNKDGRMTHWPNNLMDYTNKILRKILVPKK